MDQEKFRAVNGLLGRNLNGIVEEFRKEGVWIIPETNYSNKFQNTIFEHIPRIDEKKLKKYEKYKRNCIRNSWKNHWKIPVVLIEKLYEGIQKMLLKKILLKSFSWIPNEISWQISKQFANYCCFTGEFPQKNFGKISSGLNVEISKPIPGGQLDGVMHLGNIQRNFYKNRWGNISLNFWNL